MILSGSLRGTTVSCLICWRAAVTTIASTSRCGRAISTSRINSSAQSDEWIADESESDFGDHAAELLRRKRKADAKRRQRGADFIDHLIVTVRGGRGGNGAAAFAPSRSGGLGPPSGGNGGPGGSVYLVTSPGLTSLASVSKRLIGQSGGSGAGNWRHGKRGEDVVVKVPVGTVIRELRREGEEDRWIRESQEMDLSKEEKARRRRERWFTAHPGGEVGDGDYRPAEDVLRREGYFRRTPTFEETPPLELDITKPIPTPLLLAKGGRGGLGNPHFALPPPSRAPRLASKGAQPATLTFSLELKLLADVGLVGFPNAGKSTILRALTGRRAEVAGYEFTTLNPQVGVVRVWDDGGWSGEEGVVEESQVERDRLAAARLRGDYVPTPKELRPDPGGVDGDGDGPRVERMRFTISDNPGLLPLASENVGLGHSFLRSIERSLALAYVLDLSRPHPEQDYLTLKAELEAYKPGLSDRAAVVVLNKGDEVDESEGKERVEAVRETVGEGVQVMVISGKYGLGLEKLVGLLADRVDSARQAAEGE